MIRMRLSGRRIEIWGSPYLKFENLLFAVPRGSEPTILRSISRQFVDAPAIKKLSSKSDASICQPDTPSTVGLQAHYVDERERMEGWQC